MTTAPPAVLNAEMPTSGRPSPDFQRQVPKWSELAPLLRFKAPTLDRTAARLAGAADIGDLRRIAKRRVPTAAFDYVDGAANREIAARRNEAAFARATLVPSTLQGHPSVDLSTTIAGGPSALPFGIAPTGFTRFMHAAGEIAGVRAAERAGIPFTLSTMGTRSIEAVRDAAPDARRWFQLYLWKDRDKSRALIDRAAAAGYDTLMVTVDTTVAGQRLRDARNGMAMPPQLTLKTVADAALRPNWWFDFLTTDPLTFASISVSSQSLPELIGSMFDPTLSLPDIGWLREIWPGHLWVKGVLSPTDARRCLDAGADGIVVSNHGGRQLDQVPGTLEVLPSIRREVGPDVPLILDSGIRSGTDVAIALAAGADFALIGRAYLYGLMAGGQAGVTRAIELLATELRVAMALLGAATIDDLGPEHLTLG